MIVATPDHMHAVIASAAMDLGKHVYVQKPMCWSVHEARHLAEERSRDEGRHADGQPAALGDENRRGVDYIPSGVLGDVTQMHVWTNRPDSGRRAFPGRRRSPPTQRAGRISQQSLMQAGVSAMASTAPPPVDAVVGSVPRRRTGRRVHPLYHPFNWRGWVDWGQGALGDMGAHLIDFPVWALDLDLPTMIETDVHAVQRRLVPAGDHDPLRLSGARAAAGRDG